MTTWVQMQIQEQWFDANGDPASGYVLKAYEVGTTTPVSIATTSGGGSPQATITLNAEGKYEVSSTEVTLYIDRNYKYGVFQNATDAAANSNPFAGFFDNIVYNKAVDNVADYATLRTNLGNSLYSAGDVVTITGVGIADDFIIRSGVVTDDKGIKITNGGSLHAKRDFKGAVFVDWFGAGTGASDVSSEINDAFAACALTDGKTLAFTSETEYKITATIGRTTAGAGGTINEIHGNGAEIKYTGTGIAVEFYTDAPSIQGRLRISRDVVDSGGSYYEDLKPAGTYAATVGISAPKHRSKVWRDIYIEGFAFGIDQNSDQSIDSSYRISRVLYENIEFAACFNGFNTKCSNGSFHSDVNYVKCRYAGAAIEKGDWTITGATQADPVVVTAVGHDLVSGDVVEHENVVGMTEINAKFRVRNPTANTYELYSFVADTTVAEVSTDGTGFTAYSSGGNAFSLQGTFMRLFNDGTATSDQFPRAVTLYGCVIERAKYAVRHDANGKGSASYNCFYEDCVYNILTEDINNNPNCQWSVFGDQDESRSVISTIDRSVQKHTMITGDRDVIIQSAITYIGGIFGIAPAKSTEDLTVEGFTVNKTSGLTQIVGTNTAQYLGTTAAGSVTLQEYYRNSTNVGELRILSSNELRLKAAGILELQAVSNLKLYSNSVECGRFDDSSTATHTRFLVYDVDNGSLERVTVGSADSGGVGFKLLRIPN